MSAANKRRRITILGSTGSIGRSALDVVRHYPGRFEVVGLAAHSNVELMARQNEEFGPRRATLFDTRAADRLRALPGSTEVLDGVEGLEELAAVDVDVVLCAMVGAVGLRPLLAAIEAGNRVAVANKEPFVMAGRLVMERAQAAGVEVLPVDSEHNAVYQCLHGHARDDLRCVHLRASGGPFYKHSRAELARITPEQATRHPTWDMGAKVSVDSATLMNKGLEVVEAMWMFGLREDQVAVVIHPQSVVHSLVEFNDGHILAHLSVTDMRFPILFALTYPERVESPMARLDVAALQELTFAAPDLDAFPCLGYARAAAARGGTAPAVLNAANEVAVEAFRGRRIAFLDIAEVVRATCEACPATDDYDLDKVLDADARARAYAEQAAIQLENRS